MSRQILATLMDAKGATLPGTHVPGRGHNQVVCFGLSMGVPSPRDAASGSQAGQRLHKPLKIVTAWGPTVPVLYQMLGNPSALSRVHLRGYPSEGSGAAPSFEAHLSGVSLTGITHHSSVALVGSPGTVRHPDLTKYAEYLEVAMTYQKIEWTWGSGGSAAKDDWEKN